MPEIIIVAGPHGAGKTTFARQYMARSGGDYEYVNADEIAKELPDSMTHQIQRDLIAVRRMLERVDALAAAKSNFAVETTLSALSYLVKIKSWRDAGYRMTLIFIRLPSADDAVARVSKRVASGGHNIPHETIVRRFNLGLENLEKYYKNAVDAWYVFNSIEGDYILAEGHKDDWSWTSTKTDPES